MPNALLNRALHRRTFLKGAGVTVGLPMLTAMEPAVTWGAPKEEAPRRFVAMTLGLGLVASNLNPTDSGKGYTPSRYLKGLQDIRDDFTVISGTSHPGVGGGHRAEASILTCNPAGGSGKAKNTVSLDQYMAKHLGGETRYPSIVVSSSGSGSPSYTESGSMIPALDRPSRLFQQLFIDDSKDERMRQAERVRHGRSIMDLINDDAKRLAKRVGAGDRQRLDAYFTSIRDFEHRLAESEAWATRPKPKVDMKKPTDIGNSADFIGKQKLMCSVLKLALETDSTRFITYHLGGGGGVVPLDGVEEGYHTLSHHGLDETKLDQLAIVEENIVGQWGAFLRELASVDETGRSLLDSTSVLLTSNLGNASSHNNKNMPVLLGGGGFKHGQHLAFDQKNNAPLPNLYVSLLNRLGLEDDKFFSSTGTQQGLELA